MSADTDSPETEAHKPEKSLFHAPPLAEQERMIEALLFASAEPVSIREMEARLPHGCDPAERCNCCAAAMRGRG